MTFGKRLVSRNRKIQAPVCFAPPRRIRKSAESYIVEDANGITLPYVYFEYDPSRRGIVNRLSSAGDKAVAQTIAWAMTAAAPHSC